MSKSIKQELRKEFQKFKKLNTFKKTGIIIGFIYLTVTLWYTLQFALLLWMGIGITILWTIENAQLTDTNLRILIWIWLITPPLWLNYYIWAKLAKPKEAEKGK